MTCTQEPTALSASDIKAKQTRIHLQPNFTYITTTTHMATVSYTYNPSSVSQSSQTSISHFFLCNLYIQQNYFTTSLFHQLTAKLRSSTHSLQLVHVSDSVFQGLPFHYATQPVHNNLPPAHTDQPNYVTTIRQHFY